MSTTRKNPNHLSATNQKLFRDIYTEKFGETRSLRLQKDDVEVNTVNGVATVNRELYVSTRSHLEIEAFLSLRAVRDFFEAISIKEVEGGVAFKLIANNSYEVENDGWTISGLDACYTDETVPWVTGVSA